MTRLSHKAMAWAILAALAWIALILMVKGIIGTVEMLKLGLGMQGF